MPTYGNYRINVECNARTHESAFPNLFPSTLEQMCCNRILTHLIRCGKQIEKTAKRIIASSNFDIFDQEFQYPYYSYNAGNTTNQSLAPTSTLQKPALSLHSVPVPSPSTTSNYSSSFLFTKCNYFIDCVNITRYFITTFLASSTLDTLTDTARRQGNAARDGHLFCFSVLCNDRLARLVGCLHKEIEDESLLNNTNDNGDISYKNEEKEQDWSKFLASGVGSDLFLACLSQLTGLSSLTIQDVATNEMLYVIADTCHRLSALDLSYSSHVTDLGLVYLCGKTNQPNSTSSSYSAYENIRCLTTMHPPLGCKYLRELHFNPRTTTKSTNLTTTNISPIMPRMIAYIFRHLSHLQVVNMENLYDGIEYYYRGVAGEYHPRPDRIAPLKLVQYIGQDDQLTNIVGICPKLRAFKIMVTSKETLNKLGVALSDNYASICLDHVTLVYDERHRLLAGFNEFISKCGHRINSLEISTCTSAAQLNDFDEDMEDPRASVSLDNLATISHHCKLLESLSFNSFKVAPLEEATPIPSISLEFRFLTSLQLSDICMTQCPKEIFKYILGNSPDLERLEISFETTSFFFNDFLLEDILSLNPLGRLEEFTLENGALTLISALRLLSSRPKLKSIGNLLKWDVEPSELQTFEQILRKAKGLNVLRHDIQIY